MTGAAARVLLGITAMAIAMVAASRPVSADEGWVITSFASDITIASDSELTIVEDIHVDFGTQQHHGIFRTIPIRYRYDDNQDRYYDLTVLSVTDGNSSQMYDASVDSGNEVIKIGDPSVLVTGAQRYVISYSVVGAMNSFSDHDELFWNIDGALWPVPKQSVTATFHVPAGSFQKAVCYQGAPGSTEACTSESGGTAVHFATTRELQSGEEMSAAVALNKGAVAVPPPMLEGRLRQFPQDAFDLNPATIGISAVVLLAGLFLVAWNWWLHGRDRAYLTQYYLTHDPREHTQPLFKHEPVVVEFEPPQKMRAAELGLILDESADAKDVTATIVDLAVGGFMTIAEIPGKKDWLFTWKGSADESALLPYENTILSGLFAGKTEVKLSDLKGKFQPTLQIAEHLMYSDAMSRRLFTISPRIARGGWGCAGVAVVITGCAIAVGLGLAFGWGLVGAAIAAVGVVLAVTSPAMPQRTAAGRDLMQHTLGFRLYMTTAEKYREQFAAKAGIFNQLLPYAIVFGCVGLWAKAFEGIDTSATNSWYVGPGPFQASLLANNLESMNASISSTLTYSASGSGSGFGGGAGGGGGGGGGGAW
ncbi:MAG TPA: DUF2207 domain-containing protein [Candidatus Dormibacteraeota bacterium]|nr:DUF2207 domain-containing protein [Candidatus Dormibacteraeota bacterium]